MKLTQAKAYWIITTAGLITYISILGNGFLWDDEEQIVNNAIIQHLSNITQIFSGATFSTGGAGLSGWFFRPLLTLSYMLNFTLFGGNAWGFHLTQLIFHIFNGILIFKILQRLSNTSKHNLVLLINTVVAVIFTIHSSISEAVSYIAASSEIMYSFFNLLAFYLVLKMSKFNLKRLILISVLILSGQLFKESSLAILPILGVYLWLFNHPAKKKLTFMLGSTLLFYLILRLGLVHTPFRQPEFAPISGAPLFQRILTIPAEFTHYLSIIFYPGRLAISQHFVINSPSLTGFVLPLIISLLFVSCIFYLSIRFKSKLIFFGLIWFLLGFGLISNLFPLDMTIAERWLYFPFVGFMLILSGLLTSLPKKISQPVLILIMIAALPLAGRTMVRNTNWHDGLTLFSHDEVINKNSFDLENNVGVELFRTGKVEEAKTHFERSLALQPNWYFTWNNLGAVYEREGNWQKAEELYQETLKRSDYYLAYENLAGIKFNHESPEETQKFTSEALRKLPNNPKLWFFLSLSDYKLGKRDEATQAAFNAYQLAPSQETYSLYTTLQSGAELKL